MNQYTNCHGEMQTNATCKHIREVAAIILATNTGFGTTVSQVTQCLILPGAYQCIPVRMSGRLRQQSPEVMGTCMHEWSKGCESVRLCRREKQALNG